MTRQHDTDPDEVGRLYDQFTDVWAQALGGNVHLGVWPEDGTVASPGEAADLLTDLVADRLALRPGDRVLDVGCGNGHPALRIAARHAVHVTGITVSRHQLRQARQAADRAARDAGERWSARFLFADAMRPPFPAASFDAAFADESLLHMPDRATVLGRLHQAVRPGGRLAVADLLLRGPVTGPAAAAVAATAEMFRVTSFATADDLRGLLERTGWELEDLTDIGDAVRPSYDHVTSVMREFAAAADTPGSASIRAGADVIAAFGACPEVGYVLLSARRAPADGRG
jgi:cyclopropane fatty-acyl-phospholipid synthase-like methyltransferase